MEVEIKEEVMINQKASIMQFLVDNSAYDCMPKNSLICAVQKDIKIVDAIQLLISENAQELLIWDNKQVQWNFLFSLADAIRFTLFAVQSFVSNDKTFQKTSFRKLSDDRIDRMIQETQQNVPIGDDLSKLTIAHREQFLNKISHLTVYEFMSEVYDLSTFKLIRVGLQVKLTAIILSMLTQKIHRVVVEDKSNQMVTSILSYKDFLLFLTRSVNQQFTNTAQYTLPIGVLLQKVKSRQSNIESSNNIWTAFDIMINKNKSQWIHVVDQNQKYIDTLFRQDFYLILQDWKVQYVNPQLIQLTLTISNFLQIKKQHIKQKQTKLPDLMFFDPKDTFKDVVQKIILSQRNTLIWVNQDNKVQYTLGISELFSFYILS